MRIRLVVLDVDGVLTDNSVYVDSQGMETYRFNKRDGKGIQLLKESGAEVIALTSERINLSVGFRLQKLGVDYHYGIADKKSALAQILESRYSLEEVAFIGDDVQDIELLEGVGMAFCPQDAHESVFSVPGIKRGRTRGGEGVVRELADYIIKKNFIEDQNENPWRN